MQSPVDRRSTRQRTVVLEAVEELAGCHPTADAVFERVRRDLPGISLSTVYRNLGILCEQGSILPVRAAGTEVHYDARTRPHGHARCRACGRVFDLPAEPAEGGGAGCCGPSGFRVEQVVVTVIGLCGSCGGPEEEGREREWASEARRPRRTS